MAKKRAARKLDEKVALPAIKALMGNTPNYAGIKSLVEQTKEPRVVAKTIQLLLAHWSKSSHRGRWRDTGALTLIFDLATSCPLPRGLCDTVTKTAAAAGFIGWFPELPKRILKRNPDEKEITMLVSAYVENKASRGEHIEQKLEMLARTYCSEKVGMAQIARINTFKEEWETEGCLY